MLHFAYKVVHYRCPKEDSKMTKKTIETLEWLKRYAQRRDGKLIRMCIYKPCQPQIRSLIKNGMIEYLGDDEYLIKE